MVKTSVVNLNNPNILTVNNDTTIGEDSTDLMVVNSNAEFTGSLTVNGDTRFMNDVDINETLITKNSNISKTLYAKNLTQDMIILSFPIIIFLLIYLFVLKKNYSS